jgi:hypothetical protein
MQSKLNSSDKKFGISDPPAHEYGPYVWLVDARHKESKKLRANQHKNNKSPNEILVTK